MESLSAAKVVVVVVAAAVVAKVTGTVIICEVLQ